MRTLFYWIFWALFGRALHWPWTRRRLLGFERLPRPPYLLAANHVSHFDPSLLSSCFPAKIDYLAFAELFRYPLRRWFFSNVDSFPLDRSRLDPVAVRTAVRRLARRRVVGIFAEGGIRSGEESVLAGAPLRPGAAAIAQLAGVPLVPCLVLGGDQLYDPRAWLARPEVLLAVGPPLRTRPGLPPREARAELTERLARALRQLYHDADTAGLITDAMRPRTAQARWAR